MYKVVSYYQEDHSAIEDFQKKVRCLYSEYNFYIRNAILSVLNGTSDTSEIANRLNKTQTDLGEILSWYYPPETTIALTDLLKTHVSTVVDYIKLAKVKQDLTTIQQEWAANTDEIASILSSIDPVRWSKSAVVSLLTQNANYIHRQIVARLANEWQNDIDAADLEYSNILDFADIISDGIVKSNLEKFSK